MIKWMHLSDIHFNLKGYDAQNIRKQLLVKLKEMDLKLDFILITGDSLFKFGKGSWNQKEVIKYIKKIASTCGCSNRKIFICPGNHDIDRDNIIRNDLISDIREEKEDFSEKYDALCEYGHDRFQIIHKNITSSEYENYKVFAPRKELYRIISLDSCLISKDKEDCGKLKIFNEKIKEIEKKIKDDKRINILIMHHGKDSLDTSEARKFEHWVEDNNIDLVCCGHTHEAGVISYNELNRNIEQFTAGAIVVDKDIVPSFYICEYSDLKIQIKMSVYSFSNRTETWEKDNRLLRKFKNGEYTYELSRHKELIIGNTLGFVEDNDKKSSGRNTKKTQEDVLDYSSVEKKTNKKNSERSLNEENEKSFYDKLMQFSDENIKRLFEVEYISKFLDKYGSDRIYSNKHAGYEKFSPWRIINSLVEIGISFPKASEMTYVVINKITSSDFQNKKDILSSKELRDIVYDTIINNKVSNTQSEYEISCWASRYARKYSMTKEMMVVDNKYKERYKLNYDYIKNILLKKVMNDITNNKIFYEKLFHKELTRMAEDVLKFIKSMEIFEIREDVLLDLVKEYITQIPHPWVVNGNRKQLIEYHKEQAKKHIDDLRNQRKVSLITQMEAAYHICASFLVQYDDYIGCTEVSPITILQKSINNVSNKSQGDKLVLPMQKYQIIQLKKDLVSHDTKSSRFQHNINILFKNIVNAQKISLNETKDALIELWEMLIKLEEPIREKRKLLTPLEKIREIFVNAKGFVVKSNLRELNNCFWVEPNWEEYEIFQQHLGKQILVCVLDEICDVEKIYKYLYIQRQRENITEIVFAFNDFSCFSADDRKKIREFFKGKYLRCIFVQKENFIQVSEKQNWRTVFFKVLEISKIS